MDNNINFTGAFLVKRPNKKAVKEMTDLIKSSKIIREKFEGKSNTLFVTRPSSDCSIANYILDNKLNFDYYPNITVSTVGCDASNKNILNLIKQNQGEKVSTLSKLRSLFPYKESLATAADRIQEAVNRTIKLLNLTPNKYNVIKVKGVTKIVDKKGKFLAATSPINKEGKNYVIVPDKISDNAPKHYTLSNNEIKLEPNTLSSIKRFINNFKQALGF